MTNTNLIDYTYVRSHYPNNNSWYRELVYFDETLVAEIKEPVESTRTNKVYEVHMYRPFRVADGYVKLTDFVARFSTVSKCKDFINAGGLLK